MAPQPSPPADRSPPVIPDRTETRSAPPDLDFSGASLFAYKADYSGFFTDLRHDPAYPSFYEQEQEIATVDVGPASTSSSRLPAPLSLKSNDGRPQGAPETLVEAPSVAPTVSRAPGDIGRSVSNLRPGQLVSPSQCSTGQATVDCGGDGLWTHLDRLSLRHEHQVHQPVPVPAAEHSSMGSRTVSSISAGTTTLSSRSVQQHLGHASSMIPNQTQPQEDLAHHPHQLLLHSEHYQQHQAQPSELAPASGINNPSHTVGHQRFCPPTNPSKPALQEVQQTRLQADTRTTTHLHRQPHYAVPYSMPTADLQAQAHAFAAAAAAVAAQQHHHHQQQQHVRVGRSGEIRHVPSHGQYGSRSSAYPPTGPVAVDGSPLHNGMLGLAYPGGVPTPPNDYLSAQAMAAAAAAAAAVYKGGGLQGLQLSNGGHGAVGGTSLNFAYFNSLGHQTHSGGSANGGGRSSRGSGGYGKSNNHGGDRRHSSESLLSGSREGISPGGNSGSGISKEILTPSDLIGRAEELARDQQGCRACQRAIEEGDSQCIDIIFEECFDKFVELTTHAFANYLTQKIFQYCSDEQRLALVQQCAPAMATISTNMHGTRAVQRMVECLSTPEQVRAVCDALSASAVSLMCDINGNHVIQKVLHRMEPADNQFVYDAVANNCYELATQRHACCVMQRCMDFATPQQRDQLAVQIIANALPLVSNCYSNYVVQYLLDLNIPAYTEAIVSRLRGNVASLSMQKFASNVIEKSLQNSSQQCRQYLIAELVDPNVMSRLLLDSYANYVIQRALMVAEGEQLEQLCEAIRPHLGALKSSAYGKRIQAKLLKRMPKTCLPLTSMPSPSTVGAISTLSGLPSSSSHIGTPHNGTL